MILMSLRTLKAIAIVFVALVVFATVGILAVYVYARRSLPLLSSTFTCDPPISMASTVRSDGPVLASGLPCLRSCDAAIVSVVPAMFCVPLRALPTIGGKIGTGCQVQEGSAASLDFNPTMAH